MRMRSWSYPVVLFAALACASPGAAQQAPISDCADQRCLWLPRPADTGKPIVFDAPARAIADGTKPIPCGLALACRLEVIGKLERNGAVELRATAFTW